MIKPGDKVRVIGNSVKGNHPVEDRFLVAGDKGLNKENSMRISDVVKEEFTFIISRNKS